MKALGGLIVALTLVLTTGVGPASAAYAPPRGATFNVPTPWGSHAEEYRIVRTVDNAIWHIRPTSWDRHPVIYMSTFLLDDKPSVDALIAARKRHVSVRVVMDRSIESAQARRLMRVLNRDNRGAISSNPATWGRDHSYALMCRGSCRGSGPNDHSKFFAFSHSGQVKNVVMVSSSNLNKGGAVNGWNDLYVMEQRPKTFRAYAAIHRQMTDDVKAGARKVQIVDGPFTSRFFPMANATRANDPTMQDLDHIRCHSAFGRTQINVSMFYWAGPRGWYLASKLLQLARNGCAVSVIYGAPSKDIRLRLSKAARAHLINLYDSRWDLDGNGSYNVRTHGKYVLVKGSYRGNRSARVVMTGSQNWVAGSLNKGDEVTLNIALPSAYRKYLFNWELVRQHSRRIPQHRR